LKFRKGFLRCIDSWLEAHRLRKSPDQDAWLLKQFAPVSDEDLPKRFKVSLAHEFSVRMAQELPDLSGGVFDLFSSNQRSIIKKRFNVLGKGTVQHAWFSLLQCKDLSPSIPDSLVIKAYQRHKELLGTVRETPADLLLYIKGFARQFAQQIPSHYANSIPLAPTNACFENRRSEGGLRSFLEPRLAHNFRRRVDTQTRMDPVVINLVGPPGTGKSYTSEIVNKLLAKKFGIKPALSRYSRSLATDHWDGYNCQLITQIDDVFTKIDITEDARQFIQMCSNTPWVVPMADLKEKGTKFRSEFLLLSSNTVILPSMTVEIFNPLALARRLYRPAYRFLRRDNDGTITVQMFETSFHPTDSLNRYEIPLLLKKGTPHEIAEWVVENALETYDQRLKDLEEIDETSYSQYFVPIHDGTEFEYNCGYLFPPCPSDIPKVRASAIREPCKVRMITVGEGFNYILKPIQKAMFRAMQDFPCFRLTSGQCILDNFRKLKSNQYLVSGDYEAATDNLNMDVTLVIAHEIAKVLPKWVRPYFIRESGHHVISYPPESGIEPFLQTNGQLMGSLLSFPMLCVANAATYGYSRNKKIEDLLDVDCLINGDDIAFRSSIKEYHRWRKVASSMGLIPSVGKNYVSFDWFTINSQFVRVQSKSRDFKVYPSEGYNLLWNWKASSGEIDTLRPALERFPKETVARYLKKALRRTPRSMDISVRYGGLGPTTTKDKFNRLDRLVNLHSFVKNGIERVCQVDEFVLCDLPLGLARQIVTIDRIKMALSSGSYPAKKIHIIQPIKTGYLTESDELDSIQDEWTSLLDFRKKALAIPAFREFLNSDRDLLPVRESVRVRIWVPIDVFNLLPHNNLIDFNKTFEGRTAEMLERLKDRLMTRGIDPLFDSIYFPVSTESVPLKPINKSIERVKMLDRMRDRYPIPPLNEVSSRKGSLFNRKEEPVSTDKDVSFQ